MRVLKCSVCGEQGHRADGRNPGRCSRAFLAARMVVRHGTSVADAARSFSAGATSVWQHVQNLKAKVPG